MKPVKYRLEDRFNEDPIDVCTQTNSGCEFVWIVQDDQELGIDKKQAAALIPILQRFVDTGSIEEQQK